MITCFSGSAVEQHGALLNILLLGEDAILGMLDHGLRHQSARS